MTEDEKSEALQYILDTIEDVLARLEYGPEGGVETLDDVREWLLMDIEPQLHSLRTGLRDVLGLPDEHLAELVRQRKHLTLVWPAHESDDDIPF